MRQEKVNNIIRGRARFQSSAVGLLGMVPMWCFKRIQPSLLPDLLQRLKGKKREGRWLCLAKLEVVMISAQQNTSKPSDLKEQVCSISQTRKSGRCQLNDFCSWAHRYLVVLSWSLLVCLAPRYGGSAETADSRIYLQSFQRGSFRVIGLSQSTQTAVSVYLRLDCQGSGRIDV